MKKVQFQTLPFLVLSIFVFGFISSCTSKSDCCVIIDVNLDLHYLNKTGENLINSSTEFDESNIKIYYKKGTEFEYIYKGNLDYPNMYRISKEDSVNIILTVFPSNYYEGNRSTTLIKLNENVVDTLIAEFDLATNREVCTHAWLNGVEFNNRFIEVTK